MPNSKSKTESFPTPALLQDLDLALILVLVLCGTNSARAGLSGTALNLTGLDIRLVRTSLRQIDTNKVRLIGFGLCSTGLNRFSFGFRLWGNTIGCNRLICDGFRACRLGSSSFISNRLFGSRPDSFRLGYGGYVESSLICDWLNDSRFGSTRLISMRLIGTRARSSSLSYDRWASNRFI
jgi:hypothetical protein